MAEELTIEETNALRAKIGLPPLRPKLISAPEVVRQAQSTEHVGEVVDEVSDEVSDFNDEENPDIDAEGARDGEVLVLEDVDVLDTQKRKLISADAALDSKETNQPEDGRPKKAVKVDKRNFAAQLARTDGSTVSKPQEQPTPQQVAGARLYKPDFDDNQYEESTGNDNSRRAKKSKKDKGEKKEQTKIIRRQIHRGTVVTADLGDEEESQIVPGPRVFGSSRSTELDDDDDDAIELAASLARARKINTASIPITSSFRSVSQTQNTGDDEFEVFVPVSDFARIEAADAAMAMESVPVKLETSEAEGHTAMLELSQLNQPESAVDVAKVDIEPPQVSHVQGPPSAPKQPKVNRRSLASTLAALKAEGDGKRDEIVVGRANDAKPLSDLNKPGDLVKLEYRDDHGRLLTQKEGYRQLMYQFRGEGPGPAKKKKREEQLKREQAARSDSTGGDAVKGTIMGAGLKVDSLNKAIQKDHVVLWKN